MPLPGHDPRPGIFGPGALEELPRIAKELGLSRVLLVTGKNSFAASGASGIVGELRRSAAIETWSDFAPNPDIDDVVAGAKFAQSFQPDGIVAIGGGSVMDMAKLLAVFLDTAPEEIAAAVRANHVTGRSPGLILAPTTSGSGSEATHFAVAYVDHEKYSVAHQAMLPDYVIVDPNLTESASSYQKATSVIDAVAQAVESRWARGSTVTSRSFADAALSDLVPSAVGFVKGSSSAAVQCASGSYLAGRAIDLSKTTGAHAMAYGLTSRHGISHGHAVAITLGGFARLHAAAASTSRGADDLQRNMDSIAGLIGADGADQVGDRLDEIAGQVGLELRLGALGVARSELAVLTSAVNLERLANNPVEIGESELSGLLESSW